MSMSVLFTAQHMYVRACTSCTSPYMFIFTWLLFVMVETNIQVWVISDAKSDEWILRLRNCGRRLFFVVVVVSLDNDDDENRSIYAIERDRDWRSMINGDRISSRSAYK